MKYLLIVFAVALLFTACKKVETPKPQEPVKTEICKLDKVTYKYKGQDAFNYILDYHDNGNLKGITAYDPGGVKGALSEITYVMGSWMAEEVLKETDGTPLRKHAYRYNDQGRVITRLLYNNSGSGLQLWERIDFSYSNSKLPNEIITFYQTVCTHESEFIEKNRKSYIHDAAGENIIAMREYNDDNELVEEFTFEYDSKPNRRNGFALQYWGFLDDYEIPMLLSKNNVTKITVKYPDQEEIVRLTAAYTYNDKGLVKTELRTHHIFSETEEFIYEDKCVVK